MEAPTRRELIYSLIILILTFYLLARMVTNAINQPQEVADQDYKG